MRWWAALVLCACNQILGIDETAPLTADAPIDGPGCSSARFENPMSLQGTALATDYDPQATNDPHVLWIQRTTTAFDIWMITETAGLYDTIVAFNHNDMTRNDLDPTLTADGLTMLFVSDRLGGSLVYETSRASTGDAFGPPAVVTAIAAAERGIDVSHDGLRLYFANGNPPELRMVERTSRAALFGSPGAVLATNVSYPALSPDELELFLTRYDMNGNELGVFRLTRTTTSVLFPDEPDLVVVNAGDADMAPDSMRLYFTIEGNLGMMTRTCN